MPLPIKCTRKSTFLIKNIIVPIPEDDVLQPQRETRSTNIKVKSRSLDITFRQVHSAFSLNLSLKFPTPISRRIT